VLPVMYELVSTATCNSISQLTVSRLSRQCGILNISQPYRPPMPVTGIAFTILGHVCDAKSKYRSKLLTMKAAKKHKYFTE
jgi:hypothetical protein